MDYFFWDDVFGCREQLAKELLGQLDPLDPPAEEPLEPQGTAVVISWAGPSTIRRRNG